MGTKRWRAKPQPALSRGEAGEGGEAPVVGGCRPGFHPPRAHAKQFP